MIQLKNIDKYYDSKFQRTFILKGIDLVINEGEFLIIMGPSGSGKTTLLNIIGMLDEPSAGLAPLITNTIFNDVRRLNREIGLTVLMIEQNAQQGLKISDRGYVLELGRNSYEGTGQELLENQEVRRAFLGGR